ncbi:RimJ/RimL family protein N-acetyltransferase [Conyzicola lurida]|uniref:RimJ/RimL family protein N-acetyltransferase n=1 Tax=Conyzicola lurida TaxID=1172621 RepID=A0A841ATR4_9MICO|nr:GNAT family N-acetyltransferase [Conyzicola lurida]MBB5845066.1 RimJ/RimL family protein N-acetyltransferase [Conyzicola lurida]
MPLPWTPAFPVRTERLDLRAHTPADLSDLFEFHSDPEVVRYIPWPVRTLDETRFALLAKDAQKRVDSEGQWLVLAIELRETGKVVGEVLLKYSDEDAEEGELGFALHGGYQRRGLGYEAAHAMLALGFGEFGLRTITATLDARNAASAALLDKLGMTRTALVPDRPFKGELVDELHYAISSERFV